MTELLQKVQAAVDIRINVLLPSTKNPNGRLSYFDRAGAHTYTTRRTGTYLGSHAGMTPLVQTPQPLQPHGPTPDEIRAAQDAAPWSLFEEAEIVELKTRKARKRKSTFKKRVFSRYGRACCFCVRTVGIQAAHLVSHSARGTDDPRNGLPMCANHHGDFDSGRIVLTNYGDVLVNGYSLDELQILHLSIRHLPAQPHVEAIERHRWYWTEQAAEQVAA